MEKTYIGIRRWGGCGRGNSGAGGQVKGVPGSSWWGWNPGICGIPNQVPKQHKAAFGDAWSHAAFIVSTSCIQCNAFFYNSQS